MNRSFFFVTVPMSIVVSYAAIVGAQWEHLSTWQRLVGAIASGLAATTIVEWNVRRERNRCIAAVCDAEDTRRWSDNPDEAKREMARDAVREIIHGGD